MAAHRHTASRPSVRFARIAYLRRETSGVAYAVEAAAQSDLRAVCRPLVLVSQLPLRTRFAVLPERFVFEAFDEP